MGEHPPHIPVLIHEILRACAPIEGLWLDGTLGAGGYSRALLDAGARAIIGIDRDPKAHEMAAEWMPDFEGKITLHQAEFSQMDALVAPESLDGIVLDIGVSSMQLDEAERGFSFMKDGPLDMRMSQEGQSAADLVNSLDEAELANVLYLYGEEKRSRRIARAIVIARKKAPFSRTLELVDVIEHASPSQKPGQPHPATRSFQALRIAVNRELDELQTALEKAIDLLKPGGKLVIVTFHSLEDRIVKQFFNLHSGKDQGVNRHQPEPAFKPAPALKIITKKPVMASEAEVALNPRARSAKLRIAQKLEVAS